MEVIMNGLVARQPSDKETACILLFLFIKNKMAGLVGFVRVQAAAYYPLNPRLPTLFLVIIAILPIRRQAHCPSCVTDLSLTIYLLIKFITVTI